MTDIIAQLQFSATITGPICLMLGLGVLFKRINLINENFIEVASRIVFQVTLPAMRFFEHRQFKARFFLKHFLSGIQLNCQYAGFFSSLSLALEN